MVDGADHVSQQLGIAVAVAGHHDAQLSAAGLSCQGCQQRVRLKMIAVWVAVQGEKVIPYPDGIDSQGICSASCLCQRSIAGMLRVKLDSYTELAHDCLLLGEIIFEKR